MVGKAKTYKVCMFIENSNLMWVVSYLIELNPIGLALRA